MSHHEIQTLESRTVYTNRWMRVREDIIERSDGSRGLYGVVEKSDFAVIVPLGDSTLTLVQQYRYPVGGRYWEFPQGSWEDSHLSPEELARAELQEETGLTAGRIDHLGHLFVAYGYSNQGYDVFLARQLAQAETRLDAEELGLVAQPFTIDQVRAMILNNEIKDATTVAVFGLLVMRGLV